MRSKATGTLFGLAALSLVFAQAAAGQPAGFQEKTAQGKATSAPAGLMTGPATVAHHWSKNPYPDSIPDGVSYYIVVRGDTLWDLSKRFLNNPYLWPQVWNDNKYIRDAHWIYPGDPIMFSKFSLVAESAGQGGATGTEEEGQGLPGEGLPGVGEAGAVLYPITEQVTLQCAPYIVQQKEDDGLKIIGSEEGSAKNAFADRDILYLSKGSNAGIKAGDVFSFHQAVYDVRHPVTNKKLGTKIEVTGWGRVILVQENAATLMVDQACADIHAGDYLKVFEKANVPLVLKRPPSDRLTPPSGKVQGYVVDQGDDAMIAGTGHIITLDLGTDAGIAPGNVLSVFRVMYQSVPTPRNVIGELAIIAVREKTSTAKVIYSKDTIMNGDQVELR